MGAGVKWVCAACHESDVPRYHSRAIVCELCRDSAAARGLAWCAGRGKPHRVTLADMGRKHCKAHEAEARHERYTRNRERDTANARAYYYANHERESKRKAAYRAAHKDEINEYSRTYRAVHREHTRAYARAWAISHPEHKREANAAWKATNRDRVRSYDRAYRIRKKLRILRGFAWNNAKGSDAPR